MAKRTYPNSYFAWYNDDKRVAIVCEDTTASSGERTTEKYDTYQDADVTNGLRITYHSKYENVSTSNLTTELSAGHGLDTGMQQALVCYMKARMFEDSGDIQRGQYYRQMYEKAIKQYPSRKSGIRTLAVPKL
tara:strand:+ start:538 stop:936 length:399 start_codon:yes stop_codon:yes gene_type:complete